MTRTASCRPMTRHGMAGAADELDAAGLATDGPPPPPPPPPEDGPPPPRGRPRRRGPVRGQDQSHEDGRSADRPQGRAPARHRRREPDTAHAGVCATGHSARAARPAIRYLIDTVAPIGGKVMLCGQKKDGKWFLISATGSAHSLTGRRSTTGSTCPSVRAASCSSTRNARESAA